MNTSEIIFIKKILFFIVFVLYTNFQLFCQVHDEYKDFSKYFAEQQVEGSFVFFDVSANKYIRYNPLLYSTGLPPGEMFNILLALAALDKGILKDENTKLDPDLYKNSDTIYKDMTLKSTVERPPRIFFRNLAIELHNRRIKKILKKNHFGNQKHSGSPFSIAYDGKLLISPEDHIDFFCRLQGDSLAFSENSHELVKKIYTTCDSSGIKSLIFVDFFPVPGVNHFAGIESGYIEKEGKLYFFVLTCETIIKNKKNVYSLFKIKERILRELGILPPIPEKIPAYTLDEMLGQMILVGVDGTSVDSSDNIIRALKNGTVGGVILFEKNINKQDSYKNLKKLVSDLRYYSKIPLFVCIDQEGGIVNRLKPVYGFPQSVTARYLGKTDNLDTTRFYADTIAYTLSCLGINVNFAPVVDIALTDNFITKSGRCFSENPDIVIKHAAQFIRSHQKYGVISTLKHFPGHGSATSDSHHNMVDVTTTWSPVELRPYNALIDSGLCEAIMTAHIINASLDNDSLPGTLSSKIIRNILRDSLGFNGVVFSDDMQMKAISQYYGFENSIKLCINAGVDILLFSHNIKGTTDYTAEKVHTCIKKFIDSGEISKERIEESFRRIMRLKEKYSKVDL